MFKTVRVLSEEQLEELRRFDAPWVNSHVDDGSSEKSYLDKFNSKRHEQYTNVRRGHTARKSVNKVILHEWFEDINQSIEEETGIPITDCNYLRYDEGDFLVPHRDTFDGSEDYQYVEGEGKSRTLTTITMVNKSEDLEGGILIIRHLDDGQTYHDLEIGETVIFPSNLVHECTLITKGWREVYVGWA
jgi:predicted 2-oxoglutarate/Fe(II)-dependent dioxygenase YbiX